MRIHSFIEEYLKNTTSISVRAEGTSLQVFECDVSAYPFNQVWPGYQRPISQTEKTHFVMFESDGEVTLEVEKDNFPEAITVRPISKCIIPQIIDNKAYITFPGAGQYSVEFGNMHDTLLVFINPEKEFNTDSNLRDIIYIPKGVHIYSEKIYLEDNQTLFLDEGAVLYGSVNAVDKKNVSIIGYGILDNSYMERANEINGCAVLDPNAKSNTGNPIFMSRCKNIHIEGITIVNSSGWNVYLDGCNEIEVDNIKLIGNWRYNSDGVDFCNCKNGVLKKSFLRTFDDCVTVKGFKLNNHLPVENILVEDCVLWCDWGKALEIGAETCAPYIKNIKFTNCNVIHGSSIMLDIHQGDCADIENVHFENINIEYSGEEMVLAIQEEKCQAYPFLNQKMHIPIIFGISAGLTMWSVGSVLGNLKNINFKNINIISKNDIIPKGQYIKANNQITIDDIYFENIVFNGRKCEYSELDIVISECVPNIYYDNCKINIF